MKHLHSLAAVAAALVLAACGGSSGSSNNSSTSTSTSTGNPTAPASAHIEAVVLHPTTYDDGSQANGQTFILQDLQSIQSLDQVQFQLVYYDATGKRVVLPADQWTDTDTSGAYGALAYNNGVFVVANATTPSPISISVVYNNHVYNSSFQILPRQVRERGVIVGDQTQKGLSGIEVDFYGFSDPTDDTPYAVQTLLDVAGNSYTAYAFPQAPNPSGLVFLGKTTTQSDGTFRGSTPQGTFGFTLVNNTLPTGYQRIFRYRGQLYNTGDVSAYGLAPLPTPTPIVTPPTSALPSPLPDPLTAQIQAELPIPSNYLLNGEYFLATYSNKTPSTNGTIELIPTGESVTPPTY